MQSYGDKQRKLAPESSKTRRARNKLLKQWEAWDSRITQDALAQTTDKIYKWIEANAVNRVSFKKKDIRLFDQNQNAATLSQKIQQFANQLYVDLELQAKTLLLKNDVNR